MTKEAFLIGLTMGTNVIDEPEEIRLVQEMIESQGIPIGTRVIEIFPIQPDIEVAIKFRISNDCKRITLLDREYMSSKGSMIAYNKDLAQAVKALESMEEKYYRQLNG